MPSLEFWIPTLFTELKSKSQIYLTARVKVGSIQRRVLQTISPCNPEICLTADLSNPDAPAYCNHCFALFSVCHVTTVFLKAGTGILEDSDMNLRCFWSLWVPLIAALWHASVLYVSDLRGEEKQTMKGICGFHGPHLLAQQKLQSGFNGDVRRQFPDWKVWTQVFLQLASLHVCL